MIWVILACVAALVSIWAQEKRYGWAAVARAAFYVALASWILADAGGRAFQGGETSLLGWFVIGLAALLVGELMAAAGGTAARWSLVPVPVMAVCFALGFDVLRPDAYATIPAAILGAMVLAVAVRAYLTLSKRQGKKASAQEQWGLLLKIVAEAFLVYAAIYKVIDRGWPLPWAYMAASGGLFFAAAQAWIGWRKLLGRQTASAWVIAAASHAGLLLMVTAAVFVYREFL